jgi:3-oxoadipate enol-lactonase
LVVGHGLFGSIELLNDRGWIDFLSSEFKVVIPEYRAHSKSDTPSDHSLFTLEHRVSDVIAVMDYAGIDRAVYLADSLGSVIGFGLAGAYENRFSSFVLGGAHPYQKGNS